MIVKHVQQDIIQQVELVVVHHVQLVNIIQDPEMVDVQIVQLVNSIQIQVPHPWMNVKIVHLVHFH